MFRTLITSTALTIAVGAFAGCADDQARDRGFSTSGNREADQRAEQRMARDQQLKGDDAGSGGKVTPTTKGMEVEAQKTLYERLGGDVGLNALMDDFINRVIQDPTVNWERKGVQRGGFSINRNRTVEWAATPENKATLKKHLVQFIALKTGGPVKYEGKEMKSAHEHMRITNIEFDASVGDLKQSLDKLQIATQEQKELLQIIESTREQIVTER